MNIQKSSQPPLPVSQGSQSGNLQNNNGNSNKVHSEVNYLDIPVNFSELKEQPTAVADAFIDNDLPVYRGVTLLADVAPSTRVIDDNQYFQAKQGAVSDGAGIMLPISMMDQLAVSKLKATSAQQEAKPALEPSYVEKYTTVKSRTAPNLILAAVVAIFRDFNVVDFSYDVERFMVEGEVYVNQETTKVKTQVFCSKSLGGVYLVEFQRRSGSCMLFNQFFSQVKQALARSIVLVDDKPKNSSISKTSFDNQNNSNNSNNKGQSLFDASCLDYEIQVDEETLKPLQAFVDSEYVDVARQGMNMLGRLSLSTCNHVALAASCSQVLLRNLLAKDEELCRLSLFVLANVTQTEEVCVQIATKPWLDALFQILSTEESNNSCNKSQEIYRQASRVILNISQCVPNEINKPAYVQVLQQRVRVSVDHRFKAFVDSALARLVMEEARC